MDTKEKRNIKKYVYQLIKNERIHISVPYAKKVRVRAEKLISRAKKDTVANRRLAAKTLPDQAVKKLFEQIGPANMDRPGGYTRFVRTERRAGDGTEIGLLEIIDV